MEQEQIKTSFDASKAEGTLKTVSKMTLFFLNVQNTLDGKVMHQYYGHLLKPNNTAQLSHDVAGDNVVMLSEP